MNGIVNVVKPPGMSSHDVISVLRRIYQQKRVGHAGTLDPGAAGVLPVYLGQATRLIEYTKGNKHYRAQVLLGKETDTGDDLGKTVKQKQVPALSEKDVLRIFPEFLGEIQQIPPLYSAISQGGQKLYQIARSGGTVPIPARPVSIYSLTLLQMEKQGFWLDVHCSQGTYIRSLCRDMGHQLNCCGTMGFLLRLQVGEFKLNQANSLEEIAAQPLKAVLAMDSCITHLPVQVLPKADCNRFRQGQRVFISSNNQLGRVRVYDNVHRAFWGIAHILENGMIKAEKVIAIDEKE